VIFVWLAVIFLEMTVAGASLAWTAAWISLSQSMVDERLLPEVVIVLDEPDEFDEFDELELEEALLTVMTDGPSWKSPGRHHAGPVRR
jgi:hypothetical protein